MLSSEEVVIKQFSIVHQSSLQQTGEDRAIFNFVGRNQELLCYGFLRFVIGRENLRHPPNQSGAEQRHL